jgi:hypothetical protein
VVPSFKTSGLHAPLLSAETCASSKSFFSSPDKPDHHSVTKPPSSTSARAQSSALWTSEQCVELRTALRQYHNWLAIVWRNPFSSFTSTERLTVQIASLFVTLVVNAFLLSKEGGGFTPGAVHDLALTIIVTVLGFFCRFPAFFALRKVFESAKPHSKLIKTVQGVAMDHSEMIFLNIARSQQKLTIPQWGRRVGYGLLVVVMSGSYILTLVYGLRFELDPALEGVNIRRVWVSSTMLAVSADALLISPLK